ncbi:hypothetical protein JCM21900_005675 [Sporobolomyces salmonicolor]
MPYAAALMPSSPPDDSHADWQVVLAKPSQRKVVLYHPTSNSLAVSSTATPSRPTSRRRRLGKERVGGDLGGELGGQSTPRALASDVDEVASHSPLRGSSVSSTTSTTAAVSNPPSLCPFCYQSLRPRARSPILRPHCLPLQSSSDEEADDALVRPSGSQAVASRALNKDSSYFELLSEASSLTNTPMSTGRTSRVEDAREGWSATPEPALDQAQLNEGYFAKFFEEVQLLGRGGQGAVYLVRHVLNGEGLGLYACKKIAVGDSTTSLLRILREVHLLEAVQHPNIISYHHAWLESSIPSTFSPSVPTLHVLMGFANGGSLMDFISARGGGRSSVSGDDESGATLKERFRRRKSGRYAGRAVHLLRVEDVLELFSDVVVGLAFLHSRNILHLDLKAENVLLHWDEDALLPTCKLSDFGNATNDSYHRERHGGSGTLEYTPPEAWMHDAKTGKLIAPDRSTDQWALGLILHLLCFFTLPYSNSQDTRLLEEEIRSYRGFFPSDALSLDHGTRHDVPRSLLRLMAKLIHVSPPERPNCEKVLQFLRSVEEEVAEANARAAADDGKSGELVMSHSEGLNAPRRRVSDEERIKSMQHSALQARRPPFQDWLPPIHSQTVILVIQPRSLIRPATSPSLTPVPFPLVRALAPPKEGSGPACQRRSFLQLLARSACAKRKAFAGVVALLKLASLSAFCSSSCTLWTWVNYLILLETVLDVAIADMHVTLV